MVFDTADMGCHADGANGHEHVRARLAELVEVVSENTIADERVDDVEAVIASLRGTMPDDAWDENEALEILECHTAEAVTWLFEDGCLILTDVDEDR